MSLDEQAWVAKREGIAISALDEGLDQRVNKSESPCGLASGGPPSVSVVIPVLNEAKTIDYLVRLVRLSPRVLEVLVVDDGSTDGTGDIASRAGARVMMSTLLGKGASMEDGVAAAAGDIVLFLDGGLRRICDDLVERMTAPIVAGQADLVKAKFSRDEERSTVLTARPLLSAFFPELATFEQPLGGIVAARRSLLARVRLESDYGVDVGLLIDASMKDARVVEVDVGRIDHESRSLEALDDMARQVTQVILDRAWEYDRLSINLVREMEETERRTRAEILSIGSRPDGERKYALFDMDGVLVEGGFVAELADRVGVKDQLLRFLDNRMLPDEERTGAIASLFTGVPLDVFQETARSLPLMDGAVETVVALRRAGYVVGIVTDSFQVGAEIVRRRVFADFSVAHLMRFRNRLATGEVALSPIMLDPDGCPQHHCCKSNVVRRLRESGGLVPEDIVAVGGSASDICMLREAGVSIAFRPRSTAVESAAKYSLGHSLTGVLDLLDLGQSEPRIRDMGSRLTVPAGIPLVVVEKAV